MRRPALHHPHTSPATPGWAHPYAPSPLSPILYADGGDPDPTAAPPPADPPKPGPPPSRVFTQDEVTALAAKEKAQGERAGARAALEKWAADNGFSNVDDAAAFIEEARKAREAQLSEQEKQAQKLEADRKAVEAEKANLAAERRTIRLEQTLTRLGAVDSTNDQGEEVPNLQDAMAMLERELRASGDDSPEAVATAAEKIKKRRPELFGVTPPPTPGTPPPAPGGAPAGGPPPRTPAPAKDAIRSAARQRAIDMGLRAADDAA
ncbi:hypothetical protein ACFV4E_22360 [Streptomyces hygroscopicus]|uniref:Uncharacterized protein n=1 Tax=Streptomyces hygroscopicus TaxID=1912 RepID=A0ABQ3UFG4_STRHY|nr:hypothetical protein [Streptomyces hygroscopicus]GHJ34339.1 hypothetical protein TPA0910_87720 [Streptomyces hygroscopicus]